MTPPLTSKRKGDGYSNGILLIGIAILFVTNAWWPGILLVLLSAMVVRQYLRGRLYDSFLSIVILGGLFVFSFFDFNWNVLVPVLFVVGGLYLIFREYLWNKRRVGEDKMEDEKMEIKDADKH